MQKPNLCCPLRSPHNQHFLSPTIQPTTIPENILEYFHNPLDHNKRTVIMTISNRSPPSYSSGQHQTNITPTFKGNTIMQFQDAIRILQANSNQVIAPVCIVRKPNGLIDAQLPTGNPNLPFIPVNDSQVTRTDLLEVMDESPSLQEIIEDGAGYSVDMNNLFSMLDDTFQNPYELSLFN